MLRPEQLRVGNWIATFDPRDGKSKKEFPVQVSWRHLRAQEVEHKENFNPLPLTNAILLANGWKQNDGAPYYTHAQLKENLMLSKDDKGFVMTVLPDKVPVSESLVYVHELQNLFYSLSKQEWQIDPKAIPG